MVLECQEEGATGAPRLVVKFEWKDSSRQSEGEIYGRIAALALASGKPTLLSSIPKVVAAETFSTVSTSRVRTGLGVETHSREFTALVMTKLDGPIHELDKWALWDVLWDAIDSEFLFSGPLMQYRRTKCSASPPVEPRDNASRHQRRQYHVLEGSDEAAHPQAAYPRAADRLRSGLGDRRQHAARPADGVGPVHGVCTAPLDGRARYPTRVRARCGVLLLGRDVGRFLLPQRTIGVPAPEMGHDGRRVVW